ncbi:hypothetical protein GX917_03140 [Candidatus Falkowbacteria bacterium]|jgi:glycine betaine/choline ABC-type transport system substrate-binding protein|nr:hypothetical protein [Candidatus Falkowbacteria bacterium]
MEWKKERLMAELAACPEMETNWETWQKGINAQRGVHGLTCYKFAEYWARLMQKDMSEGKKLENVADERYDKVNTLFTDTSFYMHEAIISILVCHWKYGELLYRYYYNPSLVC